MLIPHCHDLVTVRPSHSFNKNLVGNLVLTTEFGENVNWPPQRVKKADVSSVSPPSERLEELWIVCGFHAESGATLLVGIR